MKFSFRYIKKISAVFLTFFSFSLSAEIPEGYYQSAEGKTGAELKTALHNIIRQHIILNYDTSTYVWWYTYFKATDWHPDGYFWDMYSNNKRSTYNGNLMNREHCMPRSWWGTSSNYSTFDANGDLVNLSPSDAEANTAKSNYPLGVVGSSVIYTNGVVKVGNNTYTGYNGVVFEPADQYKGDFARTYMYMVTCYEDYANNWRGTGTTSMLQKNTYPVFKPWAIELLLKWSTNDPVSQKEINRNEGVYQKQKNRNPFIDYPELVDFIWGTRNGEQWRPGIGNSNFVVSPNPASSYVSVQISQPEQASFMIYDLSGIYLKNGKINSDGTIDISDLNNGIYLLTIYAHHTRKVEKLIVAHEKLIQN
ncbi:MAG TPA: endonuclease [Paludibacteraceae bacterium]|nr:endonuclease [Paludibacteraceae bacterium]